MKHLLGTTRGVVTLAAILLALLARVAHAETAPDAATSAAGVQQVVQMSNDQQTQAMALRDPSAMATTSTREYYQWLSQVIRQNLDADIVAVHLDSLSWGSIAVTGTTAQVNDRETWSMKYRDGTTTWQTGGWTYTLVLDGGTWKIVSATSFALQ